MSEYVAFAHRDVRSDPRAGRGCDDVRVVGGARHELHAAIGCDGVKVVDFVRTRIHNTGEGVWLMDLQESPFYRHSLQNDLL